MYKSELIKYLNDNIYAEIFFDLIKDELRSYREGLLKKGASVPIRLDGDLKTLFITGKEYQKIVKDFANDKVDKFFISYIADALLLSEKTVFESEDLRDRFEALTEFDER